MRIYMVSPVIPRCRETAFVVHPLLLWEDATDDEQMLALAAPAASR